MEECAQVLPQKGRFSHSQKADPIPGVSPISRRLGVKIRGFRSGTIYHLFVGVSSKWELVLKTNTHV